jgi:hypothetical protein
VPIDGVKKVHGGLDEKPGNALKWPYHKRQ